MSSIPLQASAVCKYYRQGESRVEALAGVDLEVGSGEFVAIMGASGSGKSSLLHAMAGLCSIDAGSILIDGQNITGMSDAALTNFRREHIGLVFQAFNLIPTLSAEDNIRLPALGNAGLDAKVDGLLERLGMQQRRRHKPDALSGGEQQRVAIARALVCDPAILLVDEPTGSLDSVAGQDICGLLRRCCDEAGVSIAMVTHEAEVARWADRVVVLKDGRVVDGFTCDETDAGSVGERYRECLV